MDKERRINKKYKKKENKKHPYKNKLEMPSPKKLVQTGLSIGVLGLGLGVFNKYSGGA